MPLADVKRLVVRWKDGYNWLSAEAKINEIPEFTTNVGIDGFGTLNVHFVHQRSEVKNAIPLLFVHGCECHSRMMHAEVLTAMLTRAGTLVRGRKTPPPAHVHVIVKAWHTNYVASVWSRCIALLFLLTWFSPPPRVVDPLSFWRFPRLWLQITLTPYSAAERACLQRKKSFMSKGNGYSAEQGTQPQTTGYSLADSTTGLLAWIYEKLVLWSDGYP